MKEIWKEIPTYENLYEVSNLGRVRSLGKVVIKDNHGTTCTAYYKPQILAQRYHPSGYLLVNLNKGLNETTYRVHRLVAESFIKNPDNKPYINHINGIKDDNRVENLEWVTPSENNYHAYNTGLCIHRGRSQPVAKLDDFGNIINVYINSREASVAIGKSIACSRNIRKVCEKGYGHCGSYGWKWISWEDYFQLK